MKGKKTWVAAAIVGVSGVLQFLGYQEVSEAIFMLGGALGLVGIGHKLEKNKLMVLLPLLLVCSCAHRPATVPEGCENSLIVQEIPDYRQVDVILQTANLLAAKRDLYTHVQALEAVEALEKLIKDGVTYVGLVSAVSALTDTVNSLSSAEVFVLSQYFDMFSDRGASPLDPCDKRLLLAHLAKQRRLLELVE